MNGRSRINPRSLAAFCIAAAALAAACGGSGADPTATAPPPSPTAEVAPTATPDALGDPAPDGDRAFEHARALSETIGPRPAGTEAEIAARDYIAEQLRSFGYEVRFQEFPFDDSQYLRGRVDVTGEAISAIAFEGAAPGEATGQLIDVGLGRVEEYPPGGLNGAIALIHRGEIELREKAANAQAAGASGAIVYNNVEGSLFASMDDGVIPVVAISQAAGTRLADRLAAGQVEARVEVTPPRGVAYNVIASPPGTTACRTVSGGHFDSVPIAPGASDNASGTAAVIELARVLMAEDAAAGNCFVLFGAEEVGLVGSRAYVAALSEEEQFQLRLMVNLDVVGTGQVLELIGSADVVDSARIEAGELGVPVIVSADTPGAGSDHVSFEEAGIPVLMLFRNDIAFIHKPEDVIGRIIPESLEDTVAVARAVLLELPAG